jgi:hypothetical protein
VYLLLSGSGGRCEILSCRYTFTILAIESNCKLIKSGFYPDYHSFSYFLFMISGFFNAALPFQVNNDPGTDTQIVERWRGGAE